jgi:hypothetical protein
MFNPLISDFKDLKVADLEDKISELSRKYFIAIRSGNGMLAQQVAVVLEMYRNELQTRNLSVNKIPTPDGKTDLDSLINIS